MSSSLLRKIVLIFSVTIAISGCNKSKSSESIPKDTANSEFETTSTYNLNKQIDLSSQDNGDFIWDIESKDTAHRVIEIFKNDLADAEPVPAGAEYSARGEEKIYTLRVGEYSADIYRSVSDEHNYYCIYNGKRYYYDELLDGLLGEPEKLQEEAGIGIPKGVAFDSIDTVNVTYVEPVYGGTSTKWTITDKQTVDKIVHLWETGFSECVMLDKDSLGSNSPEPPYYVISHDGVKSITVKRTYPDAHVYYLECGGKCWRYDNEILSSIVDDIIAEGGIDDESMIYDQNTDNKNSAKKR